MNHIFSNTLKVACVIPTFNGFHDLTRLLDSLRYQNAIFSTIIVDSSSTDGTLGFVSNMYRDGKLDNLVVIPSLEFNHGGTRQRIVDEYPDFDIYVFLTQDVYFEEVDAISNLLKPFQDPKVAAVCGRQIPHKDANLLAQHARIFNYPSNSLSKTKADIPFIGIKTAFMSNSFAAYRRSSLLDVDGFPNHVIFAEDMYVAAKLILKDYIVAYEGSACCRHSHNYTFFEEFRRYFDMGVFHAREAWLRKEFGGAGGEGVRFVKSELKFLGFKNIFLWPSAIFRNAVKLLAYKIGQNEAVIPMFIKKRIGMYRGYWSGPFA